MAGGSKCCPDAAGRSGQCHKDRYRVSKIPSRRKNAIHSKEANTKKSIYHEGKEPPPRKYVARGRNPSNRKKRIQQKEKHRQLMAYRAAFFEGAVVAEKSYILNLYRMRP